MNAEKVIKKLSSKGEIPFIYDSSGEIHSVKEQSNIDQISTMLIQTLETLGIDSIELIEVVGEERSIGMKVSAGVIIGNISDSKLKTEDVISRLETIEKGIAGKEVEEEKVEVTEEVEETEAVVEPEKIIDLSTLSGKISVILTEFLGDFAERVYRNQLKILGLKEEEISVKRSKELIYALGNAASLMIGPTQSQDMIDRLLLLLK